jgi:hypothetical protein
MMISFYLIPYTKNGIYNQNRYVRIPLEINKSKAFQIDLIAIYKRHIMEKRERERERF